MKTDIYRILKPLIFSQALALAFFQGAPLSAQDETCGSNMAPRSKVSIVELEPAGPELTDLRVVMAWEDVPRLPDETRIKVRDAEGRLIIRTPVTPVAGEITEILLPGVLDNVLDHGLGLTVDIGGRRMMEPYPFRLQLRCAPDCQWQITAGVKSDAVVIDRDLAVILDDLEAPGATDILTAALASAPDLLGEIVSLAIDLDQLDQRTGIPIGLCSCTWASAHDRDPVNGQGFYNLVSGSPATEEGGVEGPGASHGAVVQTISGSIERELGGHSILGLGLRCWEYQGWNPLTVTLPGGAESVPIPNVAPCEAPCGGQVRHKLEFGALLEAQGVTLAMGEPTDATGSEGVTDPGDPTECPFAACATAEEGLTYAVDGQTPLINASSSTTVRLPVGADRIEKNCLEKSALQWSPAPSEARLDTAGLASAEAGLDGFAYAKVYNLYRAEAFGIADCALEPEVTLAEQNYLSLSVGGGVQIQPWCRP